MLLPHRFRDGGEIERRFVASLTREPLYAHAERGRLASRPRAAVRTPEEAEEIRRRFAEADLAWLGVRHGQPMLYHFALHTDRHAGKAYLSEYLDAFAEPNRLELIREMLKMHGDWELALPASEATDEED